MSKKLTIWLLLLFGFFIFLALNRHAKAPVFFYKSEIFSDKAGYNVYLPALFIYQFDGRTMPDSVDIKTGGGFHVDRSNGKIITKFPYGTALLQSPFWLVAHTIDREKNGYGQAYHTVTNIAAVCYLLVGLFFLVRLLRERECTDNEIIFILTASVAGTGLMFYSAWETGMSHIYSFACFSILAFLLHRKIYDYRVAIITGLILAIRPVNFVFVFPFILFFSISTKEEFLIRIKAFMKPFNLVLCALIVAAFIAPQLIYNQYAFGSYSPNSYKNEGFPYLSNPKIAEILIAPNDGLFLYCPLLLLIFILGIYYWKQTYNQTALLLLLLVMYVALYCGWWAYHLGCGFGHRGFVDLLPAAIVLLASLLKLFRHKLFYVLIILCCIYTVKLTLTTDACFYGKHDWDWKEFRHLMFSHIK